MSENMIVEVEDIRSSQLRIDNESANVTDHSAIKLKCGLSVVRKNLKPFLEESFPGLEILWHYETFNNLTELNLNNLCDLLIDREIIYLLKSSQTSPSNPLHQVK